MLRTVHLHGRLGDEFGTEHRLDVVSFPEAVRAMCSNYPKFRDECRKGAYELVYGRWVESGERVPQNCLELEFHDDVDLHICPVLEGEGGDNKGVLSIVLGVVLVAIALIVPAIMGVGLGVSIGGAGSAIGLTWGKLAMIGGMLALGGISQMMAPTPKVQKYEEREEATKRTSFILNGPLNRIEQGGCVPVIFGEIIAGTVVVSASYRTEDYETDSETGSFMPIRTGQTVLQ